MIHLPDIVLHFDEWLQQIVTLHPLGAYVMLFIIIFLESAFFPASPFLPGDGLLFAVGVLAASGAIHLILSILVLVIGGVLGNSVAYRAGIGMGNALFDRSRWLNRNHFVKANALYQQYGGKAMLLSRFIPVVRSLVPLLAGVAKMDSIKFMKFNALSVVLWVLSLVLLTYYAGHIPMVRRNFGWVILGLTGIGFLSMVATSIRWAIHHAKKKN